MLRLWGKAGLLLTLGVTSGMVGAVLIEAAHNQRRKMMANQTVQAAYNYVSASIAGDKAKARRWWLTYLKLRRQGH